MNIRAIKVVTLLIVSVLYWQTAVESTGAREPWDAPSYWSFWYPVSLGMSAVAGFVFRPNGWWAGLLLTFAQLPVMWFNTGTGPLLVVGIVFLAALAIPAITVSYVTSRVADRLRPG